MRRARPFATVAGAAVGVLVPRFAIADGRRIIKWMSVVSSPAALPRI